MDMFALLLSAAAAFAWARFGWPGAALGALLCAGVLSEDPLFVLINSYTTGLSPSVLSYVTESVFTKKFGGHADSQELALPVTDSGLYLPCGAACRWES